MKELIPFVTETSTRKELDRIFSRKMLGSVLVGKFVGDYAALLVTRYLGTDLGYSLGIVFAIGIFVYWDELEEKGKEVVEEKT